MVKVRIRVRVRVIGVLKYMARGGKSGNMGVLRYGSGYS